MCIRDRLNITADWYRKETKDILMKLDMPLGIGLNAPYQNAGKVRNTGWEVSVGYNNQWRDFSFGVQANLSDVKNEILDMRGKTSTSGVLRNQEGYSCLLYTSRRGLHAAVGIALAALDARTAGHVAVARTVDDRLGEDRLASRLALDDDAFDGIAVFNDVGAEYVQQHFDADLLQHLQRHGLRLFGVDDRQAHMELAGTVFAGGAPRTQAVDEEPVSYTHLQLRRQSLAALRELGIDPYPAARYEVTATAREIAENFDETKGNYGDVRIAGRIMTRRIMGSASFFELQDHTGRIQVYIRRDDICPEGDPTLYNTVFKKLLDIGDFIGVEGFAFHTNTGELSVHCRKFTVLSKSIRPLPVVKEKDGQTFDAFTDPEVRYRQRYVDLAVNPQVREVFVKRAKIISTMREFFNSKGYVEVETPILQPIPGGAAARPFITHHNALDIDQYLRIASELYLKKLIVGGFDGVYELSLIHISPSRRALTTHTEKTVRL